MSLPAALTRRATCTSRILLAAATAVTLAAAMLAAALPADAGGLDTSLCSPDGSRVSIPGNLPVSACFDGHTLTVENTLQFPIEIRTDNGGTPVVMPMPGADLPGSILSMAEPAGDGLTPPNYKLAIPISDQQTTVTLTTAPDQAVQEYVWAQELYDALGYNDIVKIGEALASLLGELATVTQNYRTCLLNSSWLGDIGCLAGYEGNIVFALGRFGVKALTPGVIEASYNLIMTALSASHGASQVSAWNSGTRQFTIAAANPQTPPAPATQPAPPPAQTTSAPPPPEDTQPPAPTTAAPTGGGSTSSTPQAGPPATIGVHIEDDYYGGTWARTDPNDGTWYQHSTQPPNGAYWYPNGLGVAVDCARSAAPYVVRYADGHYETWTWWLHVTDGKWYPAAATQEIYNDGNPGVADC